jgi:leucyl aminopeptidase
MKIDYARAEPLTVPADLVVLACSEESLAGTDSRLGRLDPQIADLLRRAATEERFRARAGQTLLMNAPADLTTRRVALVGLGRVTAATASELRAAAGTAVRLARNAGAARVAFAWSADVAADPARALEAAAEGALLGAYRFDKYLTGEDSRIDAPTSLTLCPPETAARDADADARAGLARAVSTATAVARARDLVNEPAGYMTPTRIAEAARAWASETGASIEVLDRSACATLGMGLFLAVAQGSSEEPRFVHVAWKPADAKRCVVLIGKGVSFDSGGLSLKTNEGMLDMKTDMAGAAAVLAAAAAAAAENLPLEIHALAACTENMPSGSSYKLGDVIRSMSGKTVEINNTDAEGRLTLADALSYGLRFAPHAVLDFATLTGACVVALGPHTAGVMSNDEPLAAAFLAAAGRAGEEMWRLPLPKRLGEQLKSEIADFKNTGERWGGALTAGLFLSEFVGEVPWVHVDIAGPSSASKDFGHVSRGGTGFAVASILDFLRHGAG